MLTEREKVAAINAEARRRGTTYGKLSQVISARDVKNIYKWFERELEKHASAEGKKE